MSQLKLPNHWSSARLGEHCHKLKIWLYSQAAIARATGLKFLRITDLKEDAVVWETVPHVECDESTKNQYRLARGDIVVARIGATTGKAFVLKECPDAVFASYLIRLRTKQTLDSSFFGYFCRSDGYWKQIDENKGGRLERWVNIPILQRLTVPLPPLPEQRGIAQALQAAQAAQVSRQRELALERERKAALMQQFFTRGTNRERRSRNAHAFRSYPGSGGPLPSCPTVLRCRCQE